MTVRESVLAGARFAILALSLAFILGVIAGAVPAVMRTISQ
jgi:hypothetical protein